MAEQGFIVAARRRDGSAPTYVKGICCGFDPAAVYVFTSRNDAEASARHHNGSLGYDCYHVFEVSITVKSQRRRPKKKGSHA